MVQVSVAIVPATKTTVIRSATVSSTANVTATLIVYYPPNVVGAVKALYGNLTAEYKTGLSNGDLVTYLHTFAVSNNCSALAAYHPPSLIQPQISSLGPVGGPSHAPVTAAPVSSSSSSSSSTMVPGISDLDLEIGIAIFGGVIVILAVCFCLWQRHISIAQRKQMDRWIVGEVPGLNVINRYSSERGFKKTLDADDAFAFEVNNRGRMLAQNAGSGRGPYGSQFGSGKFAQGGYSYSSNSSGSYFDPRDASGRQLHNASFRTNESSSAAAAAMKARAEPADVEEEDEEEEDEEEENDTEEVEEGEKEGDKKEDDKKEGAVEDLKQEVGENAESKSAESPSKDDASEAKKSVKSSDGNSSTKSKKKNQSGKSPQRSDQAQYDEYLRSQQRDMGSMSGRVYFEDPRQGSMSLRQILPPGYYEDPRGPPGSLRQVLPQGYYDSRPEDGYYRGGRGGQPYGAGFDGYGYPRDPYYPPTAAPDYSYGSYGTPDDRVYMNRVPADYISPRDPYAMQQPAYQSYPPVALSSPGGSRGAKESSGREQPDRRPPQSPLFQPRQL